MTRRQETLYAALGLGALVVLLAVLLLVILIRRQREAAEAAMRGEGGLLDSLSDGAPAEVDPWAGREAEAIAIVGRRTVALPDGTSQTVLQRADSGMLQRDIEMFRQLGITTAEWISGRKEGTVYEVTWRFSYPSEEVVIGPRWLVQVDPNGVMPPNSQGIGAANALAAFLLSERPAEMARYMNRGDEVVEALTNHRFEGGARLGAALLVYFMGRSNNFNPDDIRGWAIVPDDVVPGQELKYQAYFQFTRDGRAQVAQWEVNLQNTGFRARNLLANRIMNEMAGTSAESFVDIRPRSLDLSVAPSEERNPQRRALRHLLSNDRLVEAVGALLAARAREGAIEYVGWGVDPTDQEGVFVTAYRFTENGTEDRLEWRVDSSTGRVEPVSPIAVMAAKALSIYGGPATPPAPAPAPGSGAP